MPARTKIGTFNIEVSPIDSRLFRESSCDFSPDGVSSGTMTLRAHFDGAVIVPDEPADLPVNVPLDVEIKAANGVSPQVEAGNDPAEITRRLEALERVVARAVAGTNIPLEMLRREHLYEDR